MQLYANPSKPDHAANNAAFLRVVKRFPWLNLYQPNADAAPWHWQAAMETDEGDKLYLDFWPHRLKGRYFNRTFEGLDGLRDMIARAIDDCRDTEEPFDVIEG